MSGFIKIPAINPKGENYSVYDGSLKNVIDTTSTKVNNLVIEGGNQYIFTQPLNSLTITSCENTSKKAEILFTDGGNIALNDTLTVSMRSYEETPEDPEAETTKEITFVKHDDKLFFTFTAEDEGQYVWSEAINYDRGCRNILNGTLVCKLINGNYTIIANNIEEIIQEGNYIDETLIWDDKEINIINGTIATFDGTNWIEGDVEFTYFLSHEGVIDKKISKFVSATDLFKFTGCAITLPNDVGLVGSSTIVTEKDALYSLGISNKNVLINRIYK